MKRFCALMFSLVMMLGVTCLFVGCQEIDDQKVVIYSSGEDYRNTFYLAELQKKFPDYDISIEYLPTSNLGIQLKNQGKDIDCDIVLSVEYAYLDMNLDSLATLSDWDFSIYQADMVQADKKYVPEARGGGSIILNTQVMAEKNLPKPTSYEDLLKPEYKGLISMPDPKSSSTGYIFLRQLTNQWGEEKAFDYFKKLTDNVLAYTTSGSGPVNALKQKEVAIGIGMTAQAVTEINDGVPLEVIFFEEGAPCGMYGNAVVSGRENDKAVMDVFTYLSTDLAKQNNEKFTPEQVYNDFVPQMENYPKNIQYGDMKNNTLAEKERLLEKWIFS